MTSQFGDMTPSSIFINVSVFLLSSLVTGPGFLLICTGSEEMIIFVYNGLTRNPEIGNIPV